MYQATITAGGQTTVEAPISGPALFARLQALAAQANDKQATAKVRQVLLNEDGSIGVISDQVHELRIDD